METFESYDLGPSNYDFFAAAGSCWSMTLTTLPGSDCLSNCKTKYFALTGSPLLSNSIAPVIPLKPFKLRAAVDTSVRGAPSAIFPLLDNPRG